MVLSNENKDTKLVIVNCDCGCDDAIQLKKLKFDSVDEPEYYLSILTSQFYSKQSSLLKLIKQRLVSAWKMLTGKEYRLCEIILTKQDLDDFIKQLKELK